MPFCFPTLVNWAGGAWTTPSVVLDFLQSSWVLTLSLSTLGQKVVLPLQLGLKEIRIYCIHKCFHVCRFVLKPKPKVLITWTL